MTQISFRDALNRAIAGEMRANPEAVVLGENIVTWGGASAVTFGLAEEFGTMRVLETPVSENAIVGQALGLALSGVPCVAEVYSADFLFCAGSEVVNDIAKWRFQHRWEAPLNLVLRMPALSSRIAAGPEHTQAIEGHLHRVNGLSVIVPGSPRDALGSLRAAIRAGDPVVYLEHRRLYDVTEDISESDLESYVTDLSKASIVRRGDALTVVAWGWMRQIVESVADQIARDGGPRIEVIDPIVLRPLDIDTIAASAARTGRLLVVEEAPRTGSISGDIIIKVIEATGLSTGNFSRLTIPDLPNPFHPDLEDQILPDERRVHVAIDEALTVKG